MKNNKFDFLFSKDIFYSDGKMKKIKDLLLKYPEH